MSVKKVWFLLGEVSKYDIETLIRSKVDDVSIIRDEYSVDIKSHRQYFSGREEVRITTSDGKQEAWLKLCFGDRLYHFSTCYDT